MFRPFFTEFCEKKTNENIHFCTTSIPGTEKAHVKEFANIIKTLKPELVVDLFGGSGLLAHTAKRAYPQARVIYNDYDNYCERLAHVAGTNRQLAYLRKLLSGHPRDTRITGKPRADVLQFLERENRRGYVDWITLSSSLPEYAPQPCRSQYANSVVY